MNKERLQRLLFWGGSLALCLAIIAAFATTVEQNSQPTPTQEATKTQLPTAAPTASPECFTIKSGDGGEDMKICSIQPAPSPTPDYMIGVDEENGR
jgi:hypothetical protein